jgi:hypothetical protein
MIKKLYKFLFLFTFLFPQCNQKKHNHIVKCSPCATTINVEGDSVVIIDGKKTIEVDIKSGEKRIVAEFEEGLEGYTIFSSMPWGSYRIGDDIYFGYGKKINLNSGNVEDIERFYLIANNFGKYKAIVVMDDGSIKGVRNDGSSMILGGKLEKTNGDLFCLHHIDLTPDSLFAITPSHALLRVDLNEGSYRVFPLGITTNKIVGIADLDVSNNGNYIGILTVERGTNFPGELHIHILNKDLIPIKDIIILMPLSCSNQLLFSSDEKELFVFMDYSSLGKMLGFYSEPWTAVKYNIEDGTQEVLNYGSSLLPVSLESDVWGELRKYYVYPEKLLLWHSFQSIGGCYGDSLACVIIKEWRSKVYLLWPFRIEDYTCENEYGAFQYIYREDGEIKSWVARPWKRKLMKVNLSTKKVELEIPMEEFWKDWEDIQGYGYECPVE